VSVDVMLNLDQVRITTEDVIGAPSGEGQAPTGVVTRARDVTQEGSAPLDRLAADGRRAGHGSSQHEVEYSVGRRVEHIVTAPGSIRRLQVVAVLAKGLGASEIEPVRELLSAAVGALKERGDTVVVYAFEAVNHSTQGTSVAQAPQAPAHELAAPLQDGRVVHTATGTASATQFWTVARAVITALAANAWMAGLALGVLLLMLSTLLLVLARRQGQQTPEGTRLSERERQIALAEVQLWLRAESAAPSDQAVRRT